MQAKAKVEEDRRHTRVRSDVAINIRTPDGGTVAVGRIRNISLGGIFIEMEPLPFGVQLTLSFSLPGSKNVVPCTGYVVWSTKQQPGAARGMRGNGVRLMDISVADMRALAGFIGLQLEA